MGVDKIAETVKLYKKGHFRTESALRDYCEENDVPFYEVWKTATEQTAELYAPCCKGCKYIGLHGMYPCNVCSRGKEDMYSPKENKTKE